MHPAKIILTSARSARVLLLLLSVLVASCSTPMINTERYHGDTTETVATQASHGPVVELQRLALGALSQQQYDQSVNYLQRAIKIEPRNAHSWHYLAQSYWYKKSYTQCLDMIERSYSYSTPEDGLDADNEALKAQCLAG